MEGTVWIAITAVLIGGIALVVALRVRRFQAHARVDSLESDVRSLEQALKCQAEIAAAAESAKLDNRRVRYQDHGWWARHYSQVRMTVATVMIPALMGVLGYSMRDDLSHEDRLYLYMGAGVLGGLVLLVFVVFTVLTYSRMVDQAAVYEVLKGKDAPANRRRRIAKWVLRDPSLWAVLVILALMAEFVVQRL